MEINFYTQKVLASQKAVEEMRKADGKKNKNQKRSVEVLTAPMFERRRIRELLNEEPTYDDKWERMWQFELGDEPGDIAEYCRALDELAEVTLAKVSTASRLGTQWCSYPARTTENITSTLNRLYNGIDSFAWWKTHIDIRRTAWICIVMCTMILNFERQKTLKWYPSTPTTVQLAGSTVIQKPISRYSQSEIDQVLFRIKKDWGRMRLGEDLLELLDHLRVRIAVLSTSGFTDPSVLDMENYRMLAEKGRRTVYRPNLAYIGYGLFFFSDVDRVIRYHKLFRARFKHCHDVEPLSKSQTEAFRAWMELCLLGGTLRVVLGQFHATFLETMIRPGDIDSYQQKTSKEVTRGGFTSSSGGANPKSVFKGMYKDEDTTLASNWGRDIRGVQETDPKLPHNFEVQTQIFYLAFAQILSAHTDIDFKRHYLCYKLCDRQEPKPFEKSKHLWVLRMMGEFYIFWPTESNQEEGKVYRCYDMMTAIYQWLTMMIEDLTPDPENPDTGKDEETSLQDSRSLILLTNLRTQMYSTAEFVLYVEEVKKKVYKEAGVDDSMIVDLEI